MSQSTVVKTVGGVTTKITTMTKSITSSTQQHVLQQQQQQQTKQQVTTKPPHKTETGKENHTSVKSSVTTQIKQQNQHVDLSTPKINPQESRTEDVCVRCNRTVYKMEEVIAEQQVWHKNCFRCKACDKPLNRYSKVDSFQIHEGVVYCKFHFKQLFGSNETPKIKPEFIIRENQPTELPEGVIRSSEQHDLGLENIQTAAVKTRYQMFEKISTTKEEPQELQRNVGLKRSATVLSKMKKFHAKGLDVGVLSNDLNKNENVKKDIDHDEDSIDSEDYDDDADVDLIRAKHAQRERPLVTDNMNEIKNKFEAGIEQGREARHQERKQEIQNIRSKLFFGKQARTKEIYQNAVADLETTSKLRNKTTTHELDNVKAAAKKAQNIKQRFETGDVYRKSNEDEETIPKSQTSNKVAERMQMLVRQQAHDQLIKSHLKVKNVEKADISNQFEFFENYNPEEHKRKESTIATARQKSVNDEDDEESSELNGIKIDGIKIDGLKVDGESMKKSKEFKML